MNRIVMAGNAAALLSAASPASAQFGDVKQAALGCVEQEIRRTPSWRALREFRDLMQKDGFSASYLDQTSDPKNGLRWVRYRVQTPSKKEALAIACYANDAKAVTAQAQGAKRQPARSR